MRDTGTERVLEKETFRVEILSPTHIGTGRKISPYEYFYDGETVKVISFTKLISSLTPEEMESLSLLDKLESHQRIDLRAVNELMGERFANTVLYRLRPSGTSPARGDIWEHIKTVYGGAYRAYIPGSEIKGFIRTAIVYRVLKEREPKYIKDIVNALRQRRRYDFRTSVEWKLFGRPTEDIFKLLRVPDVYFEGDLSLRKVYVANTTKYKTPEYYETLEPENRSLTLTVSLDRRVMRVRNSYREYLESWKECCYRFSADLIERELSFWRDHRNGANIGEVYSREGDIEFRREEVIAQLEEIMDVNTPENPVLRIGKLTGYFSHSVGMLLAGDHNLGEFGRVLGRNAKPYLFPLTRRLTLDNQTLGWCRLAPPAAEGEAESREENSGQTALDLREVLRRKGWLKE